MYTGMSILLAYNAKTNNQVDKNSLEFTPLFGGGGDVSKRGARANARVMEHSFLAGLGRGTRNNVTSKRPS